MDSNKIYGIDELLHQLEPFSSRAWDLNFDIMICTAVSESGNFMHVYLVVIQTQWLSWNIQVEQACF